MGLLIVVAPPVEFESIAGREDHERAAGGRRCLKARRDGVGREHETLADGDIRGMVAETCQVEGGRPGHGLTVRTGEQSDNPLTSGLRSVVLRTRSWKMEAPGVVTPGAPGAPASAQLTLTSISRGRARSTFGRWIVSKPLSNLASTRSASTVFGSANDRSNTPYERS